MSATPIPRTIALSLYGHLDITNIFTLPKNRKLVKTWVIPESKRQSAYDWINKQIIHKNTQAFIVFPLIENSQHESLKNVKAATTEFQHLQKDVFPQLKLALLHGKMKSNEKDQIINDFKHKKYHLLISTTVIEVGIDIPNANIIIIEGAERFGLAQLHQLRGRVGRGEDQAFCFLFSSENQNDSLYRLKLLEKYHRGIDLSRLDLKIRGIGEVFGTAQSGHLDTNFSSFWEANLNQIAKASAKQIISNQKSNYSLILEALNSQLAKNPSPN